VAVAALIISIVAALFAAWAAWVAGRTLRHNQAQTGTRQPVIARKGYRQIPFDAFDAMRTQRRQVGRRSTCDGFQSDLSTDRAMRSLWKDLPLPVSVGAGQSDERLRSQNPKSGHRSRPTRLNGPLFACESPDGGTGPHKGS